MNKHRKSVTSLLTIAGLTLGSQLIASEQGVIKATAAMAQLALRSHAAALTFHYDKVFKNHTEEFSKRFSNNLNYSHGLGALRTPAYIARERGLASEIAANGYTADIVAKIAPHFIGTTLDNWNIYEFDRIIARRNPIYFDYYNAQRPRFSPFDLAVIAKTWPNVQAFKASLKIVETVAVIS